MTKMRASTKVVVPPRGLVLGGRVGADGEFAPDLHTEWELSFAPISAKLTCVSLEHRHLEPYGATAAGRAAVLSSAVGWVGILERFSRHCSPLAAPASKGRNA